MLTPKEDPMFLDDEDEAQEPECPMCGSTETTELIDDRLEEGGIEQSITICAGCGAD